MSERNLTHVGIGPASAEPPGTVYLELRTAVLCWNIPVTLDDLRQIHAVTGAAVPAWQALKDEDALASERFAAAERAAASGDTS